MIKKDIFKHNVKAQFKASTKERIYRFVMADKMIKGAVVHTTRMVNEMRVNHDLNSLETLILGQGYIAATLLCSTLKDKNDKISMNIQCSGPIKGLDVESNGYGEVRGFLKTAQIEVENHENIKYLSTLYGAGFLTITKYFEEVSKPYSGQIALEHGSIAEDLANYFLISEQIPTGFKLSIFFDDKEAVTGAGGIFLQALPRADADTVVEVEKIIKKINSLGELFSKGHHPEEIIKKEFSDFEPKFLSNNRVEFYCRCSEKRMANYLKNLAKAEKDDMIETGPFPIEIRCHHCNSVYTFNKEQLLKLAK